MPPLQSCFDHTGSDQSVSQEQKLLITSIRNPPPLRPQTETPDQHSMMMMLLIMVVILITSIGTILLASPLSLISIS